MAVKSYRDLRVWQFAMELAEESYKITSSFPRQETYGLSAQLRRSAISIPSNISEGHARRSTREFLRFLSIAQGSAAELETQFILATRLGYLATEASVAVLDKASELNRMLHGLRASLQRRSRTDSAGALNPDP